MEKEKFIEMIQNLPFDFVENYRIILANTSNGLEYLFTGERNNAISTNENLEYLNRGILHKLKP